VHAVKLLFKKRYSSQVNGSSSDQRAKNFSILLKYIEGRGINIGIYVNIHGLSSGNLVLVCIVPVLMKTGVSTSLDENHKSCISYS
jgi:hypothetical protein